MAVRILELGGKSIRVGAKVTVVFALLNFAVWYWNTFWNVVMLDIILIHISCFMYFFANDVTCCLYLFYTSEVMLDQKGNLSNFLIQIQNGS